MNMQKRSIVSTNAMQTEQLGERIGRQLKGGETIELVSDLGGGKTTFARGLARGSGSSDKVASPTFTISKVYDAAHFQIHHFDFYRLSEPGIIADELAEVTGDDRAVTLVEWADVVQHILPEERFTITIRQTPEGNRQISCSYPESLSYLLQEVQA